MANEGIDLRKISIFEDTDPDTLESLENRAWQVEGGTGDPIYHADDSASMIYLLDSGRVRIFYPTGDDREITLEFLSAGDIFGELALVDFETRGEAAETLEPSQLTVIPADYFRRVMDDDPQLYQTVFEFMNKRRWRIQNRLKTLAYEDARKKVIYVLLDLGRGLGMDERRPEPATLHLTHNEIAEMSGLARPTTTKILNQLQDDELISMGNGEIDLEDPVSLKNEINHLA
ncbi:MAG: Crp/Fnr family transcriptional regulator [bacterium]